MIEVEKMRRKPRFEEKPEKKARRARALARNAKRFPELRRRKG